MTKFDPTRKIDFHLSDERRVTLFTDGDAYGVQFENGKEMTRARLSKAAMGALFAGFHALEGGGGQAYKATRWAIVKRETDGFEWEEVKP